MKKCKACGKLVNEYLDLCPACGDNLPIYDGAGGPPPVTAPPPGGPPTGPGGPDVAAGIAEQPPDIFPTHVQMGDYAGFWIRFAAYFIDGLIASLVALPFGGLAMFAAISQASQGQEPTLAVNAMSMIGNVMTLIVWVANNIVLQGTRGWSIGKRICRIVVLSKDGEVLGIGRTILREVFKGTISSCVCWLGFIMQAFDAQGQAWHDKIAGSYVYYD